MNSQKSHGTPWILTFSDYIHKYILSFQNRPIPGEHHFVSMYLVPRLVSFQFLKLPSYVNPDGMKVIPGDVVFYDRDETDEKVNWKFRLGIEVKIGSVKFSRTEYNDWMRPQAQSKDKPHLFVGISRHGILIGRWEIFAERFLRIAYPGGTAPDRLDPDSKSDSKSGRYTPQRAMPKIVSDTQSALPNGLRWWPYSTDAEQAGESEREVMAYLETECRPTSVRHQVPRAQGFVGAVT